MKIQEKRECAWCPVWFFPNPRLKGRQRSCGSRSCKRKQNLSAQRGWKKREREDYRKDQRDWRKDHPDYWKGYRKDHPVYTERNRVQSRIRWTLSKATLQKKLDILEVTEITMKYWDPSRFAKHTRSISPLLFAYEGSHERSQGSSQSQAP